VAAATCVEKTLTVGIGSTREEALTDLKEQLPEIGERCTAAGERAELFWMLRTQALTRMGSRLRLVSRCRPTQEHPVNGPGHETIFAPGTSSVSGGDLVHASGARAVRVRVQSRFAAGYLPRGPD
jgi:hypothetical protein